MSLEGKLRLIGGHSPAIVGNPDQGFTAVDQIYFDSRRACVERVLNQFLQGRGRTLHHFARGNLVDRVAVEKADARRDSDQRC